MAGSPMFVARLLKSSTFTLAQVNRLFVAGSIPISKLVGGGGSVDFGVGPILVDDIRQSTAGSAHFGMTLQDNVASAWHLHESTNDYINIRTSNGTEKVSFGNAVTNPAFETLGTGTWTFGGAVVAASGFTGPLTGNVTGDISGTAVHVSTAAGTGASGGTAPTFTGTAPLGAVDSTALFSGTGGAAAGQVFTTTDNQTMTLNQCAGMLLVTVGGNFCVILSNTAVVGAPAVLTVAGKLATDAGVYSIFNGLAPVGAVASHTHTGPSHTH